MRHLLYLLACLSLAPAPPPRATRTVYVSGGDGGFSFDERIAITRALRSWERRFDGALRFYVTASAIQANLFVMPATPEHPEIPKPIDDSIVIAWANDIPGNRIFVIRERVHKYGDMEAIMRHEIGHVLGARHEDGVLMTVPYVIGKSNWGDVDEKTYQAVGRALGLLP